MKEALLESTLRKMRLNRVLPTIKSFKNPNVLDIGCGWEARLLQEIEPYIAKGIGIDFKAPAINTDKIQTFAYYFESKDTKSMNFNGGGGNAIFPQDSFSQDSKCHLPFENESFEVVTMLAVLEHLNYPLEMLKQIARVLKPNGILLLTVPSHLAKPVLEFLAFKLKIVSEAEIRDHKAYYNKKDLQNLIAQVPSLHLKNHKYFQCGMNNFAIIHKIES